PGSPACARSAPIRMPSPPPSRPVACTGTPHPCRTCATLSPLPPGRIATSRTRWVAPATTVSTAYVTSNAGLSVTVRITGSLLPFQAAERHRRHEPSLRQHEAEDERQG